MMLTCPCCHANVSLELMAQDDAARELLALRGQMPAALWPHLIAYLGLFRSKSRALAWSRALRLAHEVLAIDSDHARLGAALAETVEAMRQKREAGDVRPLKNHNYLKRVLETVTMTETLPANGASLAAGHPPAGKRAQAIAALQQWAGDCWLRREIAAGLQALVALARPGTPGADTICLTADVWEVAIRGTYRMEIEEIDAPRLHAAFKGLIKQPLKDWPDPAALEAHMPPRREPGKLAPPVRSDEDNRRGLEAVRKLMEGLT